MRAHTFRTISELHIGIGYIGLAANGALVPVHSSGMHLGSFVGLRRFRTPSAVVFTSETVLSVDLVRIKDLTLYITQIEDQNIESRSQNGASYNGTSEEDHKQQIYAVYNSEPFHLDRDDKIDVDESFGECQRIYKVKGHIDVICAERIPEVSGIRKLVVHSGIDRIICDLEVFELFVSIDQIVAVMKAEISETYE